MEYLIFKPKYKISFYIFILWLLIFFLVSINIYYGIIKSVFLLILICLFHLCIFLLIFRSFFIKRIKFYNNKLVIKYYLKRSVEIEYNDIKKIDTIRIDFKNNKTVMINHLRNFKELKNKILPFINLKVIKDVEKYYYQFRKMARIISVILCIITFRIIRNSLIPLFIRLNQKPIINLIIVFLIIVCIYFLIYNIILRVGKIKYLNKFLFNNIIH